MAKNTDSEYRDLITRLKKGERSPLYFIAGEEDYFIELLESWFEENIVAKDDRDFNQYIYYGADVDLETVLGTCRQYPVMAPGQLVMLKECQSMQRLSNQLEKIEAYLANPVLTTTLVISYKGDVSGSLSKFLNKIEKKVVVFRSPEIRSYEIDRYIKSYCSSKRISIDDKSASLLSENLGTSLKRICSEIDKLEVSEKKKLDRITPEIIEKYIGISKDFNNFELISALTKRDYPRCIRIVSYFRSNPSKNPTVVTMPLIFNMFSRILIAHSLKSKDDKSLTEALGYMSYPVLREVKSGIAAYNMTQSIKIIGFIREFDAKSKGIGSVQNEYDLLQELIFNIITA